MLTPTPKKNRLQEGCFFRPSILTNQSTSLGHVTHVLANESTVYDYEGDNLKLNIK